MASYKDLPRNVENVKPHVVKVRVSEAVTRAGDPTEDPIVDFSYQDSHPIAHGSFGVVFKAKVCKTGECIAIKKVPQDWRFKSRELDICRLVNHQNLIKLRYYFYTCAPMKRDELYLGMIFDYFPDTMHTQISAHRKSGEPFPKLELKAYFYQLLRGLAYLHSHGICHRDIKPQNILINPKFRLLKICDFGSAKSLEFGEDSVPYICSRCYRAPELLFNCSRYSVKVDVWSAACIFAEMILFRPLFSGSDWQEQVTEIMKMLGTPTAEDMHSMNENFGVYKLPDITAVPWTETMQGRATADEIILLQTMMKYSIQERPSAYETMALYFFNDLRVKGNKFSNGESFPPLLNFSEHELASMRATLASTINPEWNTKVDPPEPTPTPSRYMQAMVLRSNPRRPKRASRFRH